MDEAHLNNSGDTTRAVLSSISASFRFSVTGTPIGAKCSDLYGQLRFLRVAPFSRPNFFSEMIEKPYYERDSDALRVLRSLLSRVVIRHSMVALSPRTVETLMLTFGSDAEQELYNCIEHRNRKHFQELKKESKVAVSL